MSVYALGAMFNPGQAPAGLGFYYSGDIAELVVYNRTLTAAENTQVLEYLNSKYNIGQVAAPTNSPAAGTYSSAQNVTISSVTAGPTIIRYTTDGSIPSETQGRCTAHRWRLTPILH